MNPEVRVLLADDHPVFRKGLSMILAATANIRVVAEVGDGEQALSRVLELAPDVAILDLDMPLKDGLEVAIEIRQRQLPVKVVLLTAHKDASLVNKALDAGLSGYLLKDGAISEIVSCVLTAHAGQRYVSPELSKVLLNRRVSATSLRGSHPGLDTLTPTERRVLALVAEGKTSREIGEQLFISPRTVETHRSNISEKLSLSGSNALVKFASANRAEIMRSALE
jgi:DNA-binding NarL/FixJ family response regulator